MRTPIILAALAPLLVLACEDKPAPPTASATPAMTSAAPAPEPTHAAPAPAPSASAAEAAPTKDVIVTVRKPDEEKEKTVKAQLGGSVTVYLPQFEGSTWSVNTDHGLGKATEQTIPGFAGPTTPAHEFKYTTDGKALKAGQTHKLVFSNKGKGGKPGPTFTLTIDIVG